ncbi:hypothetical protein MP228_004253 [Amoeboaphelidium protococcarum]|nr:hypothetical protein MP228_004253 [Amoeboaphelidium protococcarum]
MDTLYLAKECSKVYGWNRKDSAYYVSEFINFWLPLKAHAKDFDGTKLSPPYIIDQVWHLALRDSQEYSDHCTNVLKTEQLIHHSTKRAYDDIRALTERRQRTLDLYDELQPGERDETLWKLPTKSSTATAPGKSVKINKRQKTEPEDVVKFEVRTSRGIHFNLNIPGSTKLEAVLLALSTRLGIQYEMIRMFDSAGSRLHSHMSLQENGIEDDDSIVARIDQRGC